jgi:GNAT superfamily N-acetyltransferase
MAEEIKIVEVTSETVTHAVLLLERFFREEGFGTPPALIAANLAAMLDDGGCWAGLADTGGVFVGVVTVTTMLYVEWGRMGEIGDLYVLPAYRGGGVGRALSNAALAWCRARRCSAASVVVTPDSEQRHNLAKFYAGLGFDHTGRSIMTRRI